MFFCIRQRAITQFNEKAALISGAAFYVMEYRPECYEMLSMLSECYEEQCSFRLFSRNIFYPIHTYKYYKQEPIMLKQTFHHSIHYSAS